MNNNTKVKYSIADTSAFEELVTFHQKYFGSLRPLNIWDWQYGTSNPFKSILIVGKFNDKIIATQGAFSFDMIIDKEIYQTGKNESLIIEPEFRKKGIYTELYNFAFDEYKRADFYFIWGFTKAEGPFTKVGFSFDRIIERAILPLRYKNAIKLAKVENSLAFKSFVIKVGTALTSLYSGILLKYRILTLGRTGEYEILFDQKSDNDLLNFYLKIDNLYNGLIHINLSNEFIKWRVKKSPSRIITTYSYKGKDLVGYLFIEVGNDYSDIIDFMFLDNGIGNELMKKMYQLINEENIKILVYSGNKLNMLNRKAFSFLKKFGFYKIKGPNGFVLKQFKEVKSSLELKNWYITSIWYEGI
ncbi:MAG: GNAT family N-acetyltransferase [Bacteroidales bacterium]|nr:MAG: GNAT family N-acetyltransferase [Bacteroidales bacterium]